MALDFTLLTKEQIWGDRDGNGQLDVMKKYGTAVAPTDLTAILGGCTPDCGDRTSEGDLTCYSWSASSCGYEYMCCVRYDGGKHWSSPDDRAVSARPALPPTEVSKISPSETKGEVFGCQIVEYGEYPQTVANEPTSEELERLHKSGVLSSTGKNYIFDSVDLYDRNTPLKATTYSEYELDGKKYIRILGRRAADDSRLSSGEQVKGGKPYWVEVKPIEWLMDKSGWMVAKKCLFFGIPFDTKEKYDGDFSKTIMKQYLDTYFAKEIEPSESIEHKKVIEGLKARLAEAGDLDRARADTKPASTPERTEIAARMKRVRRERDVIRAAAAKARESGDEKLLEQIAEVAKPSMARAEVVMDKFYARREARRAARAKKARE